LDKDCPKILTTNERRCECLFRCWWWFFTLIRWWGITVK